MKITQRTVNDITVLDLDGNLALASNAQLRQAASSVIEAGARKLIVNLAKVEYMDSSGLGELIACYTKLQKLEGRFTLLKLNKRLQLLLTITKLNTVFETYETEAAALASFKTAASNQSPSEANFARSA